MAKNRLAAPDLPPVHFSRRISRYRQSRGRCAAKTPASSDNRVRRCGENSSGVNDPPRVAFEALTARFAFPPAHPCDLFLLHRHMIAVSCRAIRGKPSLQSTCNWIRFASLESPTRKRTAGFAACARTPLSCLSCGAVLQSGPVLIQAV